MSLKISVRNCCGRSLERSGSIRTDVAFHSPHRTKEIPSKKFDWMYRAGFTRSVLPHVLSDVFRGGHIIWSFDGLQHKPPMMSSLIIRVAARQKAPIPTCEVRKIFDSFKCAGMGKFMKGWWAKKDLESRKRIMKRAYGNLEIFPCFFYFSHFRLSFSSINFLGFSVLSADLRNRLKPGYVGALWNNLTILLAIFRVEVLSSNIVTLQNKKKSWPVWFRPPHKVSPPLPVLRWSCHVVPFHYTKQNCPLYHLFGSTANQLCKRETLNFCLRQQD